MLTTKLFYVILTFYHACAMCPISLNIQNNANVMLLNLLLIIWSVVNLIGVVTLTISLWIFSNDLFEHSSIGRFNDIVKVLTVILTHYAILIEAIVTRQHLLDFWTLLANVDDYFTQSGVTAIQNKEAYLKKYIYKFFTYMILTIIMEVTIISTVQDDNNWSNFWFANIFSLMISRVRHLQLTMHIDLINYRLKFMRKELKNIVKLSKSDKFTLKEELIEKRMFTKIKYMKNIYNTLWECSGHLNRSFGISQLANLMQNFVQLTCDLYWIYSVLYQNDLTYIFQLVLTLIPTFVVITIMLHSCEQCLKEVRQIGFLLHNIEKDIDNHQLDTLIENFSLQILHEPFYFSVTGFFNMDFTLLKAMVAAITTYMVIFIQFMPKEELPTNSTNTTNSTTSRSTTTTALMEISTELSTIYPLKHN